NASRWNGDAGRIAIGGDSAGGNLTAAVVTSLAAQGAGPKFRAAMLIYGVFDMERMVKLQGDETGATEMMAKAYLASQYPAALSDPRVSPLHAIKAGSMPPSFIIVGTADPLVADARAIDEALARADIGHELHVLEEMPHGF